MHIKYECITNITAAAPATTTAAKSTAALAPACNSGNFIEHFAKKKNVPSNTHT